MGPSISWNARWANSSQQWHSNREHRGREHQGILVWLGPCRQRSQVHAIVSFPTSHTHSKGYWSPGLRVKACEFMVKECVWMILRWKDKVISSGDLYAKCGIDSVSFWLLKRLMILDFCNQTYTDTYFFLSKIFQQSELKC